MLAVRRRLAPPRPSTHLPTYLPAKHLELLLNCSCTASWDLARAPLPRLILWFRFCSSSRGKASCSCRTRSSSSTHGMPRCARQVNYDRAPVVAGGSATALPSFVCTACCTGQAAGRAVRSFPP